ncbi:antibiotic biosynthesis monooxygenase family protein [Pedobacter sp. NJ-S-72]
MILEQATLNVLKGQTDEFELAFKQAQKIISGMPGYINHELQRTMYRKS